VSPGRLALSVHRDEQDVTPRSKIDAKKYDFEFALDQIAATHKC
jgi:hypothetical protein